MSTISILHFLCNDDVKMVKAETAAGCIRACCSFKEFQARCYALFTTMEGMLKQDCIICIIGFNTYQLVQSSSCVS